jgi:hypothetical protein
MIRGESVVHGVGPMFWVSPGPLASKAIMWESAKDSLSATCPRESVLPIRLRPDFSVVFEGYAGWAANRPLRQKA